MAAVASVIVLAVLMGGILIEEARGRRLLRTMTGKRRAVPRPANNSAAPGPGVGAGRPLSIDPLYRPPSAEADAKRTVKRALWVKVAVIIAGGLVLVSAYLLLAGKDAPLYVIYLLVALWAGFTVAVLWLWVREDLPRVRQAALQDQQGYERRRELREKTREFAERMENQYSWVLEMPELEQKRRALLWYEEIVEHWKSENSEFERLRGSDERDVVLYELGEQGRRMLAIWAVRRALYQWAYAYSTKDMRTEELLQIKRRIRQLQVGEVEEKKKFHERIRAAQGEQQV